MTDAPGPKQDQSADLNDDSPMKTARKASVTKAKAKPRKKKSRGESATSPRRIKAVEEKQLQALEYRKAAYTYAQIAEALGYSAAEGARQAVMSALARIVREPAEHVLTLELERLDGMFSKPYQAAVAGDLMAVSSCLSIMARKARLLGLDAPVKTDATVSNGPGGAFKMVAVTDEQVARAVAKAAEAF